MSANPHTNGGLLLRDLRLPDFRDYAVEVTAPGAVTAESTRVMGRFLRDVMKMNSEVRNFRLFRFPGSRIIASRRLPRMRFAGSQWHIGAGLPADSCGGSCGF
jgi:phosphoketolase